MLPTVTLLMGAVCGGGFTEESRLMVSVNVVPRLPLVGEMLVMPLPEEVAGSYVASAVRATRKKAFFAELLPE